MAILDEYANIRVEVVVNGRALKEYDDDGDEAAVAKVTKYVEARTGAEFHVNIDYADLPLAKNDVVADLYLDGNFAIGCVIQKDGYRRTLLRTHKHRVGDQYFERHFRFSQLEIDDETKDYSSGINLQEALKSTGEITVKLSWVRVDGEMIPMERIRDGNPELGVIPEKALKGRAISHQASFGERKAIQPFKNIKLTKLDNGHSFATYVFKYRSREALKALMIIPRTPSPTPHENPDIRILNSNQAREAQSLQRGRNGASSFIKQEGIKQERIKRARSEERNCDIQELSDDDDLSFVSAKRCRPTITLNKDGAEVIDLT